MMVCHFFAVQNPFYIRIEHDILLKQQRIENRFNHIFCSTFHVIGKILAVRSRISDKFLFIETLGIFQCLLGSKAKQTVCIPLKCGKVIELRWCYPLFFLYHGSHKSLSVFTGSSNSFCFRFIADMLRYRIQTISHDVSHIIGFFLEIHDFTFTIHKHGKCRCLHSAHL